MLAIPHCSQAYELPSPRLGEAREGGSSLLLSELHAGCSRICCTEDDSELLNTCEGSKTFTGIMLCRRMCKQSLAAQVLSTKERKTETRNSLRQTGRARSRP